MARKLRYDDLVVILTTGERAVVEEVRDDGSLLLTTLGGRVVMGRDEVALPGTAPRRLEVA